MLSLSISPAPPSRDEESLAEECGGGVGLGVAVSFRSDVDEGLLRTSLSRLDIRCIGEGVKRGGKEVSTSSSMGDSAKG